MARHRSPEPQRAQDLVPIIVELHLQGRMEAIQKFKLYYR